MTEKHILSLGAGVQSTTVYLLAMEGELHLDAAIFADTGDEPEAVYRHLEWLKGLKGPEILVRRRGRLSDALRSQKFSKVPFYKGDGQGARQCSYDYKVEVIERAIRRDVLKLAPRRRVPKETAIHQYYGISADEGRRALAIQRRTPQNTHFPLLEKGWTRRDCRSFLERRVPHEVPRSACVYCPFHSDAEWLAVRTVPTDWALATAVDKARNQYGEFAHRSLQPLDKAEFRHERQFNMFTLECEGMCGV
jgi:hypothetical protein